MAADNPLLQIFLGGVIALALTSLCQALIAKTPDQSTRAARSAALAFTWPLVVVLTLLFWPLIRLMNREDQ